MLRIRLTRMGSHKRPTYRIIVADSRWPRDGKAVEYLGYYNPRTEPTTYKVDNERAVAWLDQGAQPSEAVARILTWAGVEHKLVQLPSQAPKPSPAAAKE